MLCITRYPGESFVLTLPGGEEIFVEIAGECRHRLKVRISAPGEVKVLRTELLDHTPNIYLKGKPVPNKEVK